MEESVSCGKEMVIKDNVITLLNDVNNPYMHDRLLTKEKIENQKERLQRYTVI